MPTPLSAEFTGLVDVGPQLMLDNGEPPITFADGWGHEDQENICPVSTVEGLVPIEDRGEIYQGMVHQMEDNHIK
jgi:hypothetical protein